MLDECPQTQDVAIGTETTDLSNGNRSNIGMVTERFAAMNVAEMNLYSGQINSGDRISKGNTGVSIGSGVHQNTLTLTHCIMDSINQDTFVVRL